MKKLSWQYVRQLPAEQKRITIPTIITLVRILLTPLIVYSMVMHQWGNAFGLFLIASISDMLDGSIARFCKQQTFLGACLDPIADKLLLLGCFFALAFIDTPLFVIPQWFVYIVLIKELTIIGGATFLIITASADTIRPTLLGKLSTVVQMLFIIWLFACYFFHWVPLKTYWTMLSLLLFLVLASLVQYVCIGIRALKK